MGLFSIFFFPSPQGRESVPWRVPMVYVHGPGADMTTSEVTSETSTSANSTGVYLAALQLVFTLGWITYVIYLPKLCADVGIEPAYVILILMLDQAIFTITDTAMGIAADRIAPFVGKLGVFVGPDRDLVCGLHRAAVRGGHRARRRSGSSGWL